MCLNNYITKREKNKHLTSVEKGKIEILLKQNKSTKDIADEIGVSQRTIQREVKRGMIYGLRTSMLTEYNQYSAEKTIRQYNKKQMMKQGNLKIDKNIKLSKFLEKMIIEEKKSPYAAIQLAIMEGIEVNISLKTLYNYIDKEIFIKLNRNHLCYRKK